MEFAEEYGFKLRGDSPVIISVVVPNSLADVSLNRLIYFHSIKYALRYVNNGFSILQLGGLKEGDFIVELSGVDVKWYTQHQLAKLIQNSKQSLELKVITPIDRNYLKVISQHDFSLRTKHVN